MYIKPGCPYCQQARDSLASEGKTWEERDATADQKWKAELLEHSRGTGLTPTILEDGRVVTVGWKGGG